MAYVFPTPGEKPKKTLSLPRADRASFRFICASNASGSGRSGSFMWLSYAAVPLCARAQAYANGALIMTWTLEPIPESAKDVAVGRAASQSEEGVHINREVRSDLIYQTSVECADPWPRTDCVVEFNIATQIPTYCTGEADRFLPLPLHVTAAGFMEDVDPSLREQCETPRQRVTHR